MMKRIVFTICCSLLTLLSLAQYPVTSIPQLVPPHSIYLTDYIVPGSDKFTLNIWLNDLNEVDYDVRLSLRIEGEGISLITRPDYTPPPLTLGAGGNTLYGGDIQEYFNLNNMVVSGIDEQTLMQTGALPPGMYSFCVQAFDYRRSDVVLSQRGCTTVALSKNNPPIPVFPECAGTIPANPQSNLMFQWQSMADNTIQSEYTFTLVEVPNGINPDDALNGTGTTMIAPGEVVTLNTQFVYDINQLPLEAGRTYAYRVQVTDTEGFTTFENDGLSQSCFFYYGLPEGGGIALKRPTDGRRLQTQDEVSTIRFAWDKPDNSYPNQLFHYEMKIVPIELNQTPEEAILSNEIIWDTIMDPGVYIAGAEVRKTLELPYSNVYAWQVSAFIEDHEFAKSPVWTFNKGSLIEEFYAAGKTIYVDETENFNLNNLTGKGRVRIGNDTAFTKVYFNGITIRPGAENVMIQGEVKANLSDYEIPLNYGDNGNAMVDADSLILTTEDIYLRGQVVLDFPLPTTQTTGMPVIKTQSKRLMFNNYSLLDNTFFEETTFDLLEPYQYRAKYFDDSQLTIVGTDLTASIHVEVSISDKMKTIENQTVTIPFFDQPGIYTYTNTNNPNIPIHLLDGTTLSLNPNEVICDFSYTSSPGIQSSTPDWVGVYFSQFEVEFSTNFDESNQIALPEAKSILVQLSEDVDDIAWADGQGLQFYWERSFEENELPASFNTFSGALQSLQLKIVNNSIEEGFFKGKIKVPVLDADNDFAYTVPIDADGIKTGYLDEDITTKEIVFNEDREEFTLIMRPKQAVFQENNRLSLVADLDWESIQIYLPNVTNINIWGNGDFGFNTPNGAIGVNNVQGEFASTYEVAIDSVIAGVDDGLYAFGFIGSIVLGGTESGISGTSPSNPPKFNMVCAEQRAPSSNFASTSANWLKEYRSSGATDLKQETKLHFFLPILVKTSVADAKGHIVVMRDNPVWGNAFYGKIDATIKKPKPFNLSTKLLIGNKKISGKKVDYWFFEFGLAAGDRPEEAPAEGGSSSGAASRLAKFGPPPTSQNTATSLSTPGKRMGIKLGKIELIELKGRVYHHMNHDMTKGMNVPCTLVPKTVEVNIGAQIASLTDADLSDMLNNLSPTQLANIFNRLERSAFKALLSALPNPDFSHLALKIPNVDWPNFQLQFPNINYAFLELRFPNVDWPDLIATIPGIDWGDLLLNLPDLPAFPDLCSLNQYTWNKVIAAFDEQVPVDSAWLIDNNKLNPEQWAQLSADDPDIKWTDITTAYPNVEWCGTLILMPGIDWGGIFVDINFPTLGLPTWRDLLPSMPLNWESLGFNMEAPPAIATTAPVEMLIDVKYTITDSTSYGGMLLVGIQDSPTSGTLMQAKGSLEISFDKSYNLKQIGLQVEAGFGNNPGNSDYKQSMIQAVGCMTYTTQTQTFVAHFEGVARRGMCASGVVHYEVSPNLLKLDLGTEASKVTVVPGCIGVGAFGWVNIERQNNVTKAGGGVGLGLYANLQTPEYGFDGICEFYGFFKARAEFGIKAQAVLEPSFKMLNAGVLFDSAVDIGVNISGAVCPFGDITALHLGLNGDLVYNFGNRNLTGTVKGKAKLFDVIDANFRFAVSKKI